ncbi:MAG: ABC-F family ATP-binding cassette domain-containing protein [Desulfohalobium sp.]
MLTLTLQNLSKGFGANILFSGLSGSISSGMRVAVIGPNGCGKSTLLKIINGESEADGGGVHLPKGARIGRAEQELSQHDLQSPLLAWVLENLPNWQAFWSRWERAQQNGDQEALTRLAAEQTRLEHQYGYNPEHHAKSILSGLGFQAAQFAQPVAALSGGWCERAKLARVLIEGADILLLDEPTNHLDLEAVQWLENFLHEFPGILLFVAHDRIFLDTVATHTLSLGGARPVLREGNFSAYLAWEEEKRRLADKERAKLDRQIQHKQAFVDRFRYKATKAKQAQSRLKQIEWLEGQRRQQETENSSRSLSFQWPPPARAGHHVLSLADVSYAFPGQQELWPPLTANIYRDQRIALVGPNGCGKSTLLKLIVGEHQLQKGQIKFGTGVKLGYFSQHQTDILETQQTVLGEIRRLAHAKVKEEELRFALGLFLLDETYWERQVSELSGGEKNRLVLASLFLDRANFLILDEPTNHLDLESREALVQALRGYEGTVLVVAHDRYLLSEVADNVWVLGSTGIEVLNRGYPEYEERLHEVHGTGVNEDGEATTTKPSREAVKAQRREVAEARNAVYRELQPQQERYQELETLLESNLEKQSELEARLADPATYEHPQEALAANQEYEESRRWGEQLMEEMAGLETTIAQLRHKQDALREGFNG